MNTYLELLSKSDAELARVDPLEMNLLVAKAIPSLADLDIPYYQDLADRWAAEVAQQLPAAEERYHQMPDYWRNDVAFFRLGFLCSYIDDVLGIRYREDQKYARWVFYEDPAELFLYGVMDSRRGTCANMAALHVALGWRLGWPVSLACVGAHFICRYDNGKVIHNIETTNNGRGGFHSHPDDYYMKEYDLPQKAVLCGSDLRAVKPRELLGLFIGLRARHLENINQYDEAERDHLLPRHFFPQNRYLHIYQIQNSVQSALNLFEPNEKGHPTELAEWLQQVVHVRCCARKA